MARVFKKVPEGQRKRYIDSMRHWRRKHEEFAAKGQRPKVYATYPSRHLDDIQQLKPRLFSASFPDPEALPDEYNEHLFFAFHSLADRQTFLDNNPGTLRCANPDSGEVIKELEAESA